MMCLIPAGDRLLVGTLNLSWQLELRLGAKVISQSCTLSPARFWKGGQPFPQTSEVGGGSSRVKKTESSTCDYITAPQVAENIPIRNAFSLGVAKRFCFILSPTAVYPEPVFVRSHTSHELITTEVGGSGEWEDGGSQRNSWQTSSVHGLASSLQSRASPHKLPFPPLCQANGTGRTAQQMI